MKRNLDSLILTLDGQPFADRPTLKTLCFAAVTTPLEADAGRPVEEKIRLYALAQKVNAGGIVDLSAEDIALLKARIGKVVTSVIAIGRAFELLEEETPFSSAAEFDAAADARDMPSGATKQPDAYAGS